MKFHFLPGGQRGYSFIELIIAVGIMGILASTVMMARSFMAKQTVIASDKAYATEKAIQMFEEMRTLVNGNENSVQVLDNYADPATFYNTLLSTDQGVSVSADPANALSANRLTNGYWHYVRNVEVDRVANDPYARQVIIRVYRNSSTNPGQPDTLLATIGGILRTISSPSSPTQVFDVYVIAISDMIGWFTLVPQMQGTWSTVAAQLQGRNPGLQFRTHYITQSGFGRDPYYTPYCNAAPSWADSTAMPYIYFYPGAVQYNDYSAAASPASVFDPGELAQAGAVRTNLGYSNPYGHTLSDTWNNDVRYPDELVDYAAVSQTASNNNVSTPAITLRMLLEQMASNPNAFNNAIVVSMHGEVVPIPPIRNYSDAAKDPANHINQRVVTHPTLIHYRSGAGVTLRSYVYYDGLEAPATLDYPCGGGYPVTAYPPCGGGGGSVTQNNATTMTVYFPNLNINSGNLSVSCIYGGETQNTPFTYGIQSLPPSTGDSAGMGMSWAMGNPTASSTCVTFFNTPLRCPEIGLAGGVDHGGLPVANRLYGAEYIPCPVNSFTGMGTLYTPDLTSTTPGPKNTARWIIMVNGIPDGQYAVETRIGTDLTTGSTANQGLNLSRTYVWIGGGAASQIGTAASGITPWTERYQFNGDPRDCPYADVKFGSSVLGTSDSNVTIDSDGYNWHWKDLHTSPTDGFSGFSQTDNGYDTYNDCRDMPRYYYLYRTAMLNQGAIFVNLNGWTAWHADEGGEFGSTYQPWSAGIPLIDTPYNPTDNTLKCVDEIQTGDQADTYGPHAFTAAGTHPTYSAMMDIARHNAGGTALITRWYARTWRGELFPDDWWGNWNSNGNLPTGSGNFYRVPAGSITMTSGANSTNGYDFGRTYQHAVGSNAVGSLFNGILGGYDAGMAHISGGTGFNAACTLTTLGTKIYNITNYPMPVSVSANRPWAIGADLNVENGLPDEWNNTYYSGLRTSLSDPQIGGVFRDAYDNSSTNNGYNWQGVGTIQMNYNGQTCFFNLSGLQPQGSFDAASLGQISLSEALRDYMDAGLYSGPAHIPQVPLIRTYVDSPNDQYPYPPPSGYTVNVTISGPVTDKYGNSTNNPWFRYQGITSNTGNYYTEEYPNNGSPLTVAGGYNESVTLDINLKWSTSGTNNWQFVQDNAPAAQGVLDMNPAHLFQSAPTASGMTPVTFAWNVSGINGTVYLMAEAYRDGLPLHYCYHTIQLRVNQ